MKQLSKMAGTLTLLLFGLLSTAISFAQDAELDVNINTDQGGGAFYTQIWFWVIVGLVFILLLV
ncbi:MAG: hypothetical protein Q4G48_05350, partial [Bacteroidia bacterium]|nr:hypothetical protein [Bacteroidia bacterium]